MMRRSKLVMTGIVFLVLCALSLLAAREKRVGQSNHFKQTVPKKTGVLKSSPAQKTVATESRRVKKIRPAKRKVTIAKHLKVITIK